jgi:hypothetical protein
VGAAFSRNLFLETMLLLKKRFQGFLRFLCSIYISLAGAPQDKVITEIGPLFINNPFCRDFPAIIVGMSIVEFALFAAPKISAAIGARIIPAHFTLYSNLFSTKGAVHNLLSSISKILTILLLTGNNY